jgi:hypothetical protein
MADFILFISIIDCMLIVIFVLQDRDRQSDMRFELKVPSQMPLLDNCIEAFQQTLSFVRDRVHNIHNQEFIEKEVGMDNSSWNLHNSHELHELYRVAHMAGYRIVLYKEADADVENPKNTKEEMKKYHKDLKIARYHRNEMKHRRK